jgi:hypothetical protein
MGQEKFMPPGTTFVRKRYHPHSKTWEHDHCECCGAKLVDPDFSEAHRRLAAQNPDVLTEGYATTAEHEKGADYYWICPSCFADFSEEFGWQAVPAPADS